ncbi:MAG TPA: SAM-dependent methyltransferase [Candidatus Dormibacteraeota bacterium]
MKRGRRQPASNDPPVRAPLRGEAKLEAALDTFGIDVRDRVCLDLGAAAGGFTRVLLDAGALRVYAVDVGFGQLLGSLRQDTRVLNLEATNVSKLDTHLIPEPLEVVTIDVSYLALASAVAQLDRIDIAPDADLVGLVKPMFELRMATAPTDPATVDRAVEQAVAGVEAAGWQVLGTMPSPVLGGRGAVEALLHARKRG